LAATSITASTYNITAFNGTINGTSITLIANTCGIGVVCNYLGTGTYDNILYDPTVNGSYLDNAGILATDAAGDFINLFAGPSVGSPDIYGPCTNLGACNSVNMTPGPGNQGFAVSTPELSSLPLLALGLAGLGFAVNRKTLIRR